MTFFVLEIFDDSGFTGRQIKFPVKPTYFKCSEVVEEENGIYGYLVTYSNGNETARERIL